MFRRASQIDKYNNLVRLLILLTVFLSIAIWIDNIMTEQWLADKKKVACTPVLNDITPSVYDQSIANPLVEDIKIKNFINNYVYYTETEKYADFHELIKSNDPKAKRYDKARLSLHKQQALYMTVLDSSEFKLRKKEFAFSNKRYKELEKEGKNVIFHVDQILVNPVPFSMFTKVIVRGFYREYWDFKDKENRRKQNKLLGRYEIQYDVMHDLPEVAKKANINKYYHTNKWGLFVAHHRKYPLSKADYRERLKFSRKNKLNIQNKTSLESLKNLYKEKNQKE